MKNTLITGITGFAGSHLAEFLVDENCYSITGTYNTSKAHKNLEKIQDKLDLRQIDLTEYEGVRKMIEAVKPEVVFHLAAFPSPAESFKNPAGFLTNNISAELNLLQAIKEAGLVDTKVLIVSSSEMYGAVHSEDLPINEETPLRPVSPYGVSKIAQDYLGLQFYMAYHMPIIRVRPFGHIGPRLSADFAVSAFSKKIAEIEKGLREPILTYGNVNTKRDITDVRDMVKAYALLMERGENGEAYNAGRGESYLINDLLEKLLSFSSVKIEKREDETLKRPNDIAELRCDPTKIHSVTGWKAEISIEKSLEDTLNYWRENI